MCWQFATLEFPAVLHAILRQRGKCCLFYDYKFNMARYNVVKHGTNMVETLRDVDWSDSKKIAFIITIFF